LVVLGSYPEFYTFLKIRTFFTFLHSSARFPCYVVFFSGIGVILFNIFDWILKNSRKVWYSLALHLVETETDSVPDQKALDSDPDPQHWLILSLLLR